MSSSAFQIRKATDHVIDSSDNTHSMGNNENDYQSDDDIDRVDGDTHKYNKDGSISNVMNNVDDSNNNDNNKFNNNTGNNINKNNNDKNNISDTNESISNIDNSSDTATIDINNKNINNNSTTTQTKVFAFGLNTFGQINGQSSVALFRTPLDTTNLILPQSPHLSVPQILPQTLPRFGSTSSSLIMSSNLLNTDNHDKKISNNDNNDCENGDNNSRNNGRSNRSIENDYIQKVLYIAAGGDQSFAGVAFSNNIKKKSEDSLIPSSSNLMTSGWIQR